MSGASWIKFFPSDWLNGTVMLSPVERGVYITLIALIYDEQGPIAHNPKVLARRCAMTIKLFEDTLQSLIEQEKLTLEQGMISNEKTEKILGDVFMRSERGRKGGNAKAAKKAQGNQGEGSAQAGPKQDPGTASSVLDGCLAPAIPDTRNQKPDKKASKLAQKDQGEGQGEIPDKGLEADLRHAANWFHDAPRLSHVKPIEDLIAQGLSLTDDVIPTIRQLAPNVEHRTNWTYFVGPLEDLLKRRKAAAEPEHAPKPQGTQSAAPSQVVVWKDSPQWQAWSKGRKPWPTSEIPDPAQGGRRRPGWYFPSEWPPEATPKAKEDAA